MPKLDTNFTRHRRQKPQDLSDPQFVTDITYLVAVHFSEQASQSASKCISVLLAG